MSNQQARLNAVVTARRGKDTPRSKTIALEAAPNGYRFEDGRLTHPAIDRSGLDRIGVLFDTTSGVVFHGCPDEARERLLKIAGGLAASEQRALCGDYFVVTFAAGERQAMALNRLIADRPFAAACAQRFAEERGQGVPFHRTPAEAIAGGARLN